MTSWKGKTRGGLTGYRIFIFLIRKYGLNSAYILLKFVSVYFIFFAPTASRSIYKYFRSALNYSRWKAFISIFKNYYVFGQTLIDKIAIGSGMKEKFSFSFDGIEHLKKLKDTGGIIISGHIGNWEIAGYLLEEIRLKTHILIYEAEHEKIKAYLDRVTTTEIHVIPIKNDLSHIIAVHKAIRNKEVVCLHADRFTAGSRVVQKKFLDKKAFFPIGPFLLLGKLHVPYSYAFAFRGKGRKYNLSATPLQLAHDNPLDLLDEYVGQLESKVQQNPLQWFNYFDFWDKEAKGALIES